MSENGEFISFVIFALSPETRFPGQISFTWRLFNDSKLSFGLACIRGQKSSRGGLYPWKKMAFFGNFFFFHLFSTIFHFLTIFFQGYNPPSGWNCVESHFKPTLNVPKIWSLFIAIFFFQGNDALDLTSLEISYRFFLLLARIWIMKNRDKEAREDCIHSRSFINSLVKLLSPVVSPII